MAELPHYPYRKQVLVMATATWIVFIWFVTMVDPLFVAHVGWKSSYLPLLILSFLAFGLTFWGITGRWKRSLLWTTIVTVAVWLRMNQLDSIVNLVLLIAFGAVWEYYWHSSKMGNLIN